MSTLSGGSQESLQAERDAEDVELDSSVVLKRTPFSKATPLEELLAQTLQDSNCPYETAEQLTDENDPNVSPYTAQSVHHHERLGGKEPQSD